jgi:ubiquinone/menaquinone biosynthesis C-methylase UbiE
MSNDNEASKHTTAGDFNRRAARFDSRGTFAHFGQRLVEHTGIRPAMSVLDVATGRGAVLFPALACVGPTGAVLGVDLAESMVQATTEDAKQRGLNVLVRVMDAEQLDFPDASFDRVLCGFGVMFFPNLSTALSEFRRVLKPGGRVGVSTWRVTQAEHVRAVLEELVPKRSSRDRPPHWISDPEVLRSTLTEAGFLDVEVVAESTEVHYVDVDHYLESVRDTIRVLNELDEIQMRHIKSALSERFRAYERSDGIHISVTALLASGKL